MQDNTKIPLVSSEISGLWNSYMGDSLAICVLRFFINRVEDNEIRDILQYTLDLSNQHIKSITTFINQAKLPIPVGFSDGDVDINAPRLFTNKDRAIEIAERMRTRIENKIFEFEGTNIKLTTSFGVHTLIQDDEVSIESVINFADKNLYRAKKKGRNRVISS